MSSKDWIDYIHAEVKTTCKRKGWRHQIRRKWIAAAQPASDPDVTELEWKLVPEGPQAEETVADWYEGVYFVLWLDSESNRFEPALTSKLSVLNLPAR